MIGGCIVALLFIILGMAIRIHILNDRLAATEEELDEVTEQRNKLWKENLQLQGAKELIQDYRDTADRSRAEWLVKTSENEKLLAEEAARQKWWLPYAEKCIKYYEANHKTVETREPQQPKDKDGNFSNASGTSKDAQRYAAYLKWKEKGFLDEAEYPGIYDEIGAELGLKGSTVKQYIRQYVKGDGRYDYTVDRQDAEQAKKITTLPQAQ